MPKIELTIRRAGGSDVDLPNDDGAFTRYHFKPLDATRADSPHVADVSDAHADILLNLLPVAYVAFDAPKAAPAVARPAATAADTTTTADDKADTNGNGVLSVAEFNKAHAAGKFDELALRELLAAEEAAEHPRSSFIAAVTKALK